MVTSDVTQKYSRVAGIYDAWTWFTESRSLSAALEEAAIRDGDSVLEVAVGTGITFREVLRRNPSGRNVGIDRCVLSWSVLRLRDRCGEASACARLQGATH